MDTGTSELIGAVIGTGVITSILQIVKDELTRRADETKRAKLVKEAEEHRLTIAKEERAERETIAAALAEKTRADALAIVLKLAQESEAAAAARAEIKAAVDLATATAANAYKEANHVNNKISDLNTHLLAAATRDATGVLPAIQKTTEETQTIVKNIDAKLPQPA